jgi:hypothetical protein
MYNAIRTAWHEAARNLNPEVLKTMLKTCRSMLRQIHLECKTDMKETPLHWAVSVPTVENVVTLLKEGVDVNAVRMDGHTPLSLVKALATKESMSEQKTIIELLESHGGLVPEKIPKQAPLKKNLPAPIAEACLEDRDLYDLDFHFGGMPYDDCNETFRRGKELKVGLSVLTRLIFEDKKKFLNMHGIISKKVNGKWFKATMKLVPHHVNLCKDKYDLDGEWEAKFKFTFDCDKPWVLTDLVRLENIEYSYEKMLIVAKERETKEGRRLKKTPKPKNQTVLRGLESSLAHHPADNVRVITGIDLRKNGSELVFYLDPAPTILKIDGSRNSKPKDAFKTIANQTLTLMLSGAPCCEISANSVEFQLADLVTYIGKNKFPEKRCGCCGKTTTLQQCSSCKSIFYCGAECQKNHWKKHAGTCKKKSEVDKIATIVPRNEMTF